MFVLDLRVVLSLYKVLELLPRRLFFLGPGNFRNINTILSVFHNRFFFGTVAYVNPTGCLSLQTIVLLFKI
jgi:hypothetical protein